MTARQVMDLENRLLVLAVDYRHGRLDYTEWMARRSEVWREARTHRIAHVLKARIMRDVVEEG